MERDQKLQDQGQVAISDEIYSRQEDQWVQHTWILAERLITGEEEPDPPLAELFVVRLYDLLLSVSTSYRTLDLASIPREEHRDQVRCALNLLDDIRKVLTDDELLWIQYWRDSQCHVWPTSYDPGRKIRRKTLLGEIEVADLFAKLREFHAQSGRHDQKLARSLALRLRAPLWKLKGLSFNILNERLHHGAPVPIPTL